MLELVLIGIVVFAVWQAWEGIKAWSHIRLLKTLKRMEQERRTADDAALAALHAPKPIRPAKVTPSMLHTHGNRPPRTRPSGRPIP